MKLGLTMRFGIAYVVLGALLRVQLIRTFGPPTISLSTWLLLCGAGSALDALVALTVSGFQRLLLILVPSRLSKRLWPRYVFAALAVAVLLYEAAVEYFFFDEYNVRFNHIAVDYVVYPHEVFGNLWQSFDVGRYAFEALLGGMVLAPFLVARGVDEETAAPSVTARVRRAVPAVLVGLAAFAALYLSPSTLVQDRVANEVALNGPVQLVRAIWNASLSFRSFYLTQPQHEARARAASVLHFPKPSPGELMSSDFRLRRHITPVRNTPLRSIVVVLEESLGSEFVGCLGAQQADLTPELDRWAKEGLMLSNLFATGNRTVRGLESVLCSMVPLPGDSIVKRSKTHRVDGLPRILNRAGYQTAFFYGGRGLFDNLKAFATAAGYGSFHEQSDYPPGAFTTAWGVADEYIFDAALERQIKAKRDGTKLFATILTVSNHKPFLVPPGHSAPSERNRHTAIRYADWALGRWLTAMRTHNLLEDTAVLIVGDHGARVYGSEKIPIRSYRVPALFLSPDPRWHASRVNRLCSQIDLAATLLSLAGVSCDVPLFGSDLLGLPEAGGRAFLQHNYDLGMMNDDELAVLSLRRAATTYHRNKDVFALDPAHSPLEQDAVSVYQTAEELYDAERMNVGAGSD